MKMSDLALIGASLYAPYMDRFYETGKRPVQHEPKKHMPLTDAQRRLFGEPHRELHEFSIKGHKVMSYSRKDAITRLKHQKKI